MLAPVTGAIKEILERLHVSLKDKKIVVVGNGRLVGAPTSAWLTSMGAEVAVLTREDAHIEAYTKDADIIVLGAGKANIVLPDMVKEGVIILDAGTSEAEGEVLGDASLLCAPKAAFFTPVPGGIGPIAVAMIFKNLFSLVHIRHNSKKV